MDDILAYFVNSRGERAVLSSLRNNNYWEVGGRTGFTATDVEIFTEKMASGGTKYFGKAMKPRECSLKMVCKGKSTAERDKVFGDMLDVLLDPDGIGEGKLYVKRSNGSMVYLNCVYSGGMNIFDQYKKFRKFDLKFYAADPVFYNDGQMYTYSSFSGNPKQVVVNNLSSYNTTFRIILKNEYMQGSGYGWNCYGTLRNLTTGKKITLKEKIDYGGWFEYIKIPDGYKLMMDMRKNDSMIYLENSDKERMSASYIIDWDNTDLDFCAVQGTNTILYGLISTAHTEEEIYFPQICYGV